MKAWMKVACGLLLLTACGAPCDDPAVEVTLEPAGEEVRSLPVLASGKVHLLDLDAPDSNAEIKVKLTAKNASQLVLTSFDVSESSREVELEATHKNADPFTNGGTAKSGDTLRFHWRAKSLSELLIPAGSAHSTTVTAHWQFNGCRVQSGAATVEVPGTVKAAASATNLKSVAFEGFQMNPARGAKAKVLIRSNTGNQVAAIRDGRFAITYFGAPPAVGLGLVTATNIAMQVSGVAVNGINITDNLDVYTSPQPNGNQAPYDYAGQSAATALLGPSKALITLSLTSGAGTIDTFADLVDVQ